MICHWLRDYGKYGEAAFNPKGHPGNPFAALHTSKTLTEIERLRLQLIKLEIENERLKKGYQVKGAGANKEFVSLKDVNLLLPSFEVITIIRAFLLTGLSYLLFNFPFLLSNLLTLVHFQCRTVPHYRASGRYPRYNE